MRRSSVATVDGATVEGEPHDNNMPPSRLIISSRPRNNRGRQTCARASCIRKEAKFAFCQLKLTGGRHYMSTLSIVVVAKRGVQGLPQRIRVDSREPDSI